MKRTLTATSWIVACAFLASVAAQTPPTQQERPQAKQADDKTVTLTGCLATGDQPNTFKLTSIRAADRKGAQPGEMVGTTGIKTGEALQLTGTEGVAKFKEHVGHTVAVTGMLVPGKEGIAAAPATPDPARPGAPAMQERADMRLNVKTFKHVDAACPPAGK